MTVIGNLYKSQKIVNLSYSFLFLWEWEKIHDRKTFIDDISIIFASLRFGQ